MIHLRKLMTSIHLKKIQVSICLIIISTFLSNVTVSQELDTNFYHHNHRGSLVSACQTYQTGYARVAFLGGSITYNPGWRDSLTTYFKRRYPETEFDFINAGIPSMGSTPGSFRLERDVLAHRQVDLLFVEAAVNDYANGRTPTEITRGMEGIIRHTLLVNSSTSIVMMHFVDPNKMDQFQQGKVPEVIRLHEEVARHYNISSINLAKEVTERIDAGEFDWENDFKDLHPSPFGQNIYYQSIRQFLENACDDPNNVKGNDSANLPPPLDPNSYTHGKLVEPTSDQTAEGWQIIDNWKPSDSGGTRNNYVHVPMLVGVYPGDPILFQFEGNAVGIAVASGPNAGIIEYRIDGASWKKQDLHTRWSQQLYLPWYFTLVSGLENGKHTLEIRLSEEKNSESQGRKAIIRYFYYNAK
jgi:lysophospholipase L1-like esterase